MTGAQRRFGVLAAVLLLMCGVNSLLSFVIPVTFAQDASTEAVPAMEEAPVAAPPALKLSKWERSKKSSSSKSSKVSGKSAVTSAEPPRASHNIQDVRIIAQAHDEERERQMDRQSAETLMSLSVVAAASQSTAAGVDRLLLPLWLFVLSSIVVAILLFWNLAESRKTARSARESVKVLVRLSKEFGLTSHKPVK